MKILGDQRNPQAVTDEADLTDCFHLSAVATVIIVELYKSTLRRFESI
jgi:hypothetical protein